MKRNITVFIILILLVSSLKYGTKAMETNQSLLPERLSGLVNSKEDEGFGNESGFDLALQKMQQANKALANGETELFRSLWMQNEDVTILGEDQHGELKGWRSIDAALKTIPAPSSKLSSYTFEKITCQEGENQAYLVQEEHYKFADGKSKDLQVTVLFQRDKDTWKIIHRHADQLALTELSDLSGK